MCNPALALGAIAQGAGIYRQQQAAKKASRARTGAIGREGQRQEGYYKEAQGAQDTSRGMLDRKNFDPAMSDEAIRLAAIFDGMKNTGMAPAVTGSAPQIVKDAQAAALQGAADYNAQQNEALANLNAFGSILANQINPALSSSAAETQMLGNFMRGSSGALQGELQAANELARDPLAQLLIGGGQVATSYGLAKPK